jgi:hypothetical protein
MPKQPAFPGLRDATTKKVTRREQFLAEMDAVVPWSRLLALILAAYSLHGFRRRARHSDRGPVEPDRRFRGL